MRLSVLEKIRQKAGSSIENSASLFSASSLSRFADDSLTGG